MDQKSDLLPLFLIGPVGLQVNGGHKASSILNKKKTTREILSSLASIEMCNCMSARHVSFVGFVCSSQLGRSLIIDLVKSLRFFKSKYLRRSSLNLGGRLQQSMPFMPSVLSKVCWKIKPH